eukprot:CAMPEP_0170497848 /NCGR_PEP_ID=MMETSP0208-20121228/26013_1 /TAXON_ID=197538 /ORGANISM="Strombidium inclinatum, Strain S3" /LENGTH=182 /DNA_ID=CAMNT_0010774799 /DNA_START=294 /DNA_END=843 /DNA_ORIENTATION=+
MEDHDRSEAKEDGAEFSNEQANDDGSDHSSKVKRRQDAEVTEVVMEDGLFDEGPFSINLLYDDEVPGHIGEGNHHDNFHAWARPVEAMLVGEHGLSREVARGEHREHDAHEDDSCLDHGYHVAHLLEACSFVQLRVFSANEPINEDEDHPEEDGEDCENEEQSETGSMSTDMTSSSSLNVYW